MRKFALGASACVLLFVALASAQQVDVAVSGSILRSASTPIDLVGFHGPIEQGGLYVGLNADYVGFKRPDFGFNVESTWRYHPGPYPYNNETYRPIFTDANALFQPRVGKIFHREVDLDFLAGVGFVSNRFNSSGANCISGPSGCIIYNSSNHFLEDLGGGIRYYVWRKFFIRPEARYYHIQNNFEFQSPNVFRIGASVGYTFGHSEPPAPAPASTPTPAPK